MRYQVFKTKEGGQPVFQTREERDSSELQGGPGGYGFVARMPLKDVGPLSCSRPRSRAAVRKASLRLA